MQTVDFERLDVSGCGRLLDVGCGEGRHAHGAVLHADRNGRADGSNPDVDVVAVDLDEARLRTARADYEEHVAKHVADASAPIFCRGDALSLPFPDSSFDVVVCAEVLEHLPDYGAAIDELVRVLKPDGRLAVSVPRYGPERVCWALSDEYHQVEGGHVRIFRRGQLRDAIESRGLRCVDSHHEHALHAPYWWLKCLWWDRDEQPKPLAAYERFLERTILEDRRLVRAVERGLNPLLGKSLVLYFENE